jgi:hypothetical protein
MSDVTDQTLRRVVGVMGALLVVVLGATALLMVSRGGSGGAGSGAASATPSGLPSGSGSAVASATASPADGPPIDASQSPGPSIAPSAASASAVPSASVAPVPAATLTFVGLKLDAEADPGGEDRVITFTSDGKGKVSVKLVSQTPQGTTHMCFRAGTKELGCEDWSKGTFNGTTTQAHTNWRVTVRGSGVATPVVDVTVTYQVVKPTVKIANARFNGTAEPELNGIQVRFVPRLAGDASWRHGADTRSPTSGTFNETADAGGPSYPNQGPSVSVEQATPVTPTDTWRLILQNVDTGFGTTDLTATISWP